MVESSAWSEGVARALEAMAASSPPSTVSVTLDIGGGRREHIDWCLKHQVPVARCACPDLVEDLVDCLTGVAASIAGCRERLARVAEVADQISKVT